LRPCDATPAERQLLAGVTKAPSVCMVRTDCFDRRGAVRRRTLTSNSKRPGGIWARVAFTLTLAAFTFQSFAIQTHVHFAPAIEASFADAAGTPSKWAAATDKHQTVVPARQHKNAPDDDSANCPLCQEYLYAGNYVAPAVIALLLPPADESAVVPETRSVPRAATVSYSWYGRAPPTA
jgi:hypothetical protein